VTTQGRRYHSQYWRARAEEARAKAGEMRDAFTEATMLEIARMYDQMAERAALEEKGRPDKRADSN